MKGCRYCTLGYRPVGRPFVSPGQAATEEEVTAVRRAEGPGCAAPWGTGAGLVAFLGNLRRLADSQISSSVCLRRSALLGRSSSGRG